MKTIIVDDLSTVDIDTIIGSYSQPILLSYYYPEDIGGEPVHNHFNCICGTYRGLNNASGNLREMIAEDSSTLPYVIQCEKCRREYYIHAIDYDQMVLTVKV